MKIGMYSPYVPDHFGGGERYFFDVAVALAASHSVSIFVSDPELARQNQVKYEKLLGYSLEKITWLQHPTGQLSSIKKLITTARFDIFYYLTDGSFFFSLAKKNIAHIQVPLLLNKHSRWEQLKLANWHVKNTNSEFTKQIVEKAWPTKIDIVHYPKISSDEFMVEGTKKENVILNVGRFFSQLHSKRQDILINLYQKLPLSIQKEWQLVFIGSVEDEEYFATLKKKATGLNISFLTDISRKELIKHYLKAKIYWHAAGFAIDQWQEPQKVEHFGISTVEAMAAGAVPVVINKGGQVEIMSGELSDLLWNNEAEAITKTLAVIRDDSYRQKIARFARKRALDFDVTTFNSVLETMVYKL